MKSKREIKRMRKNAHRQKCTKHGGDWIGVNTSGEYWCVHCALEAI